MQGVCGLGDGRRAPLCITALKISASNSDKKIPAGGSNRRGTTGPGPPGRNPCLEESCASKLLAKCRGLVQKCSRHLFLFQRPALNAAASALPPSGCLTGLFAGLLGRSQHTKCVSSIPTLLLKRAINPMLCKRCLHFIYTVVFFSLLSLTAGQMPFVPLLRRDAVRFCFLRDNF